MRMRISASQNRVRITPSCLAARDEDGNAHSGSGGEDADPWDEADRRASNGGEGGAVPEPERQYGAWKGQMQSLGTRVPAKCTGVRVRPARLFSGGKAYLRACSLAVPTGGKAYARVCSLTVPPRGQSVRACLLAHCPHRGQSVRSCPTRSLSLVGQSICAWCIFAQMPRLATDAPNRKIAVRRTSLTRDFYPNWLQYGI